MSDLLLKLTKALTLALDGLALVGTKGFGWVAPSPLKFNFHGDKKPELNSDRTCPFFLSCLSTFIPI